MQCGDAPSLRDGLRLCRLGSDLSAADAASVSYRRRRHGLAWVS